MRGGCGRPLLLQPFCFGVAAGGERGGGMQALLLDWLADFPMMSEGIDDSS